MSIDNLRSTVLDEFDLSVRMVNGLIKDLQNHYEGRGIELIKVASGFRFQTRSELSPWLSKLWTEKAPKYSRAMLETLSLIAYRQPITRGEIEEVRGVAVSSSIIRTLQERGWIKVIGHKEIPGRPALFATTPVFLDYFGLASLEELPPLPEVAPASFNLGNESPFIDDLPETGPTNENQSDSGESDVRETTESTG
ncbi:SMC-Scp complex subunit ScpB [Saccharobesus litoralis]|uniref:SMC-Scp complex subunit ScpB n=2 Tax=Saccharobesus litoralis TaxID=2172099 RepID=A0A2S0VXE9_9ALTE|nr:SMC-Scp complex subunit ScpB [Saccharobesus litoralis]